MTNCKRKFSAITTISMDDVDACDNMSTTSCDVIKSCLKQQHTDQPPITLSSAAIMELEKNDSMNDNNDLPIIKDESSEDEAEEKVIKAEPSNSLPIIDMILDNFVDTDPASSLLIHDDDQYDDDLNFCDSFFSSSDENNCVAPKVMSLSKNLPMSRPSPPPMSSIPMPTKVVSSSASACSSLSSESASDSNELNTSSHSSKPVLSSSLPSSVSLSSAETATKKEEVKQVNKNNKTTIKKENNEESKKNSDKKAVVVKKEVTIKKISPVKKMIKGTLPMVIVPSKITPKKMTRVVSSDAQEQAKAGANGTTSGVQKFRPYQAEKWKERFEDLLSFKKEHGHCLVPHTYPANPTLARWVKRQRYQYKLFHLGEQSSMTVERIQMLANVGFVWHSHEIVWQERLNELLQFRQQFGHCLVPSNYALNPKLATWVKCQRRQYKLHLRGSPSNITETRIAVLEKYGFNWQLRSSSHSIQNEILTHQKKLKSLKKPTGAAAAAAAAAASKKKKAGSKKKTTASTKTTTTDESSSSNTPDSSTSSPIATSTPTDNTTASPPPTANTVSDNESSDTENDSSSATPVKDSVAALVGEKLNEADASDVTDDISTAADMELLTDFLNEHIPIVETQEEVVGGHDSANAFSEFL